MSATCTLRSHAEVSAALLSRALLAGHEPSDELEEDAGAIAIRAATRAAARAAFSSGKLAAWRTTLEASARERSATLPLGAPVDLMQAFAAPWSLDLAIAAMQSPTAPRNQERLASLARTIFLDAAQTTTGDTSTNTLDAASALAVALAEHGTMRSLDVQSFVALSHTLPHFLVAAWQALLTNADQLAHWRTLDDKSAAVDELLRFAGPSRAVFRRAHRDVVIGDAAIRAEQRVVLLLQSANRDPLVFHDADRLDLSRDASRHVAFGEGRHVCVGAPIIRVAIETATNALLERVGGVSVDDVQWLDGFAIRAPSSLLVTLSS